MNCLDDIQLIKPLERRVVTVVQTIDRLRTEGCERRGYAGNGVSGVTRIIIDTVNPKGGWPEEEGSQAGQKMMKK